MPAQHVATLLGATCCVRLVTVLRHVATCWLLLVHVWNWPNLSQQRPTRRSIWPGLKRRPNDRYMSTPHIATLLGATCCVHLATVLQCVATCWVLLAQVWKWSNLSQQYPTSRNMTQQGGQTHATCCAQQRCDMLCWHVAIVWPGLDICVLRVVLKF